jgi:hypothetical protein
MCVVQHTLNVRESAHESIDIQLRTIRGTTTCSVVTSQLRVRALTCL